MILSDVKLGEGCYGTVYLGYAKNDPSRIFAVKAIERNKVKGEKAMQALKNEVAIMADIQSEFVVALKDGTKTANNIYLSLELCNGGDLEMLRKARGQYISELEARIILQ